MVAFYLRLSSVAVVPLGTVFVVGALSRASRESGLTGMAAGLACGVVSMAGDRWDWPLPGWLTSVWWSYLWAVAVTVGAMAAWSFLRGAADPSSLRGLTLSSTRRGERFRGVGSGWLERSRASIAARTAASVVTPARWRPERYTLLLVSVTALVFFVAFR